MRELSFLMRSVCVCVCVCVYVCVRVCVQLCLTLCDPVAVDCQAPLTMEFSTQQYWSGLPFPSPGDLPDSGMEPALESPALAGEFLTTSTTREAYTHS